MSDEQPIVGPDPATRPRLSDAAAAILSSTLIALGCIGGLITSFTARRNPDPAVLTALAGIGGAAASNVGTLVRGVGKEH